MKRQSTFAKYLILSLAFVASFVATKKSIADDGCPVVSFNGPLPQAVLLIWNGAYYPTNGASQWPGHYVTALIPQENIELVTIEQDGSIVHYLKRWESHPSTVFNVSSLKEFYVHPDDINVQPCIGWHHFYDGTTYIGRIWVNNYGGRRFPCGTLKLAKDLTTDDEYAWDMQWGSGIHWFPTYQIGNPPQTRQSSGELGGAIYPGSLTGSNYDENRPNHLSFCHPVENYPYYTIPHGWFGNDYPEFDLLSWNPVDLSSGIMVLDYNPNGGPFMLRGPKTIQLLFDYLQMYFSSSLLADITGNGQVDTADLFDFLIRWFQG